MGKNLKKIEKNGEKRAEEFDFVPICASVPTASGPTNRRQFGFLLQHVTAAGHRLDVPGPIPFLTSPKNKNGHNGSTYGCNTKKDSCEKKIFRTTKRSCGYERRYADTSGDKRIRADICGHERRYGATIRGGDS